MPMFAKCGCLVISPNRRFRSLRRNRRLRFGGAAPFLRSAVAALRTGAALWTVRGPSPLRRNRLFVQYSRYYREYPRSRNLNENHMRNFSGGKIAALVAGCGRTVLRPAGAALDAIVLRERFRTKQSRSYLQAFLAGHCDCDCGDPNC